MTYLIGLSLSFKLEAQDVHYSNFDVNPTLISPSETGNFIGDYRLTGIYRNQWRAVTVPFVSTTITAEQKSPFKKVKGLHLGLQLTRDRAGDSKYTQLHANLSVSYEIQIDSSKKNTLLVGLASGLQQTNIDYDALSFNNQYNGFAYDPNLASGESFSQNNTSGANSAFGVTYSRRINNKFSASISSSINNIIKQKNGFGPSENTLARRANFLIQGQYRYSDRLSFLPKILMTPQGKYREYMIGTLVAYNLDHKKKYAPGRVYGLLFSRLRDAIIIGAGFDYNDWHIRFSYDVNTSGFTPATHYRGGFELGVQYVLRKIPALYYKRCPNYI